jgi:PAS domain S-box-containing protein
VPRPSPPDHFLRPHAHGSTALAEPWWSRLLSEQHPLAEAARLERLFDLIMLVNVGIVVCLTLVFAALEPLGLADATASRVAIAFPLLFIPVAGICVALSRRGRLRLAAWLYVWFDFGATTLAVWLFEGTLSPAWLLYIWTITVAGTLLTPAWALRMTGAVLGYFVLLFGLGQAGLYRPIFTFSPAGLEFLEVSVRMLMLVSTVGFLTFLNRRGLQRSEDRFRALIEKSTDLIVVIGADGQIAFWSPSAAESLGWSAEDAVGRRWADELHPDDRAAVSAALAGLAAAPGATAIVTARQRRRDGQWRLMQIVVRNLLHDPAVQGFVTNARDITDQRRLEEQFRQSQKMDALGRLAGGVAHDFNNLLTGILGASDYVLEQLPRNHPLAGEVAEIRSTGERAASLVRQLLTFSRKNATCPVRTDLNAGALGLEKLLRRTLGAQVSLEVLPAPDPWPLLVDPTNLEQVVLNLALNGRDSMPGGGRLQIQVSNVETRGRSGEPAGLPPGRWACLTVQDTGGGMSTEVRERIFEPFFTTKATGLGTGLGLSTVFGIVEQARGRILVESEPGRGTMFSVYFPAAAPVGEAAESLPEATSPGRGLRARTG